MRWSLGSVPRWVVIVIVWFALPLWTIVLVSQEETGSGPTGVAVKILGSFAILYILFLALKPQGKGILGLRHVETQELQDQPTDGPEEGSDAAKWSLITLTIALVIGSVFYRVSQETYLHQTSLFFIGIPAVLALTLALTPRAKSATGTVIKGLSIALMLSGVVFAEGFACIIMAAPLFYAVGIAIGVPIDRARRKKKSESKVYSIVGFLLLLLSVEGVTPATTLPQRETVSMTRRVDAPPREVRAALASPPDFERSLPVYLRFGFPRPKGAYGRGLAVGDRRTILFGDESPMEPMPASGHGHHAAADAGSLQMEIVRSAPGRVIFKLVRDATAFTHWTEMKRSVVEWSPDGNGRTAVTWTLVFERKLSPAWYFAPWQRYAGKLATGYLIDTVATP